MVYDPQITIVFMGFINHETSLGGLYNACSFSKVSTIRAGWTPRRSAREKQAGADWNDGISSSKWGDSGISPQNSHPSSGLMSGMMEFYL